VKSVKAASFLAESTPIRYAASGFRFAVDKVVDSSATAGHSSKISSTPSPDDLILESPRTFRNQEYSVPALFLCLLLLAITSPILWFSRPERSSHSGWFAAIPPALVSIWQILQMPAVAAGNFMSERYAWAPQIGLEISLRLDGLALFFGLIVTGVGAAVALYTGYYFERDKSQARFYGLLFLFMTSMLGLVWSDNLLTLFVFWEGTSIVSYLLIAFKYQYPDAKEGGRRAFIVTGLGGLAMLVGILLLGMATGTYSISGIIATPGLTTDPLYPWALLLILLGAFTKSAQFPFHFWLPGAMAAPTPASAYLHSATMVKAGVFLLARMHPALSGTPLWFWTLLIVGGITMLLGAISALRYYDLKAVLAYATVSQLGILVMLLAFDTSIAFKAVVVGILAHALYKGPLFLVAGIVDHATGTRDLRHLAHLWRSLPWVTVAAVLAALSMAGIPPTFGFLAKEFLLDTWYQTAEHGQTIFGLTGMIAAGLTGALFVAVAATLAWETFFRQKSPREVAHVHHAPSFGFVFAPLILVIVGAVIPLMLGPLNKLLFLPPIASIAGEPVDTYVSLWHGWTPVLIASLVAIGVGVVIFFLRAPFRRFLRSMPPNLNGVVAFNRINDATYGMANWVTRHIQGGTMATQASIIFAAAFLVLIVAMFQIHPESNFVINWTERPLLPETIIALLAIVSAIVTVQVKSRIGAIISLGVVGVTVTLFFVFFSAPDLALTQLLIEVLTVILLVLVFFRVKPTALPPMAMSRRIRNIVLALAMGIFGFLVVIFSSGIQVGDSISEAFLLYSVPLGKGTNVVNVILVDFRAYDTMGEIVVLAIAAVGGFALLRAPRLRNLRRRYLQQRQAGQADGMELPDGTQEGQTP
jgi:multicomponent Na+:H+ antiporter subunit A